MTIKILEDSLINKIAAGEVIENPASVIKELVENSIDAGADDIKVFVENGGLDLIKIVDNGCGIKGDELALALARHATSKIDNLEDLERIITFGFRGEALSSIAAVSKFTIRSKVPEEKIGNLLICEGGKILEKAETALPDGTEILIENLFYNVPARRKFLKSPAYEFSLIQQLLSKIILAAENCSITLFNKNKKVLSVPKNLDLLGRILKLNQNTTEKDWITVSGEGIDCSLTGYVSIPEQNRATSKYINFFVNRRSFNDRKLLFAVEDSFKNYIMKGKHPMGVLFVTVNPEKVDVNVHPQKSEVRFSNSGEIFNLLFYTLRKEVENFVIGEKIRDFNPSFEAKPNVADKKIEVISAPVRTSYQSSGFIRNFKTVSTPEKKFAAEKKGKSEYFVEEKIEIFADREGSGEIIEAVSSKEVEKPASLTLPFKIEAEISKKPSFFRRIEILGQFSKSYILGELEKELYFIDQHAAFEKVTFEKLKETLTQNKIESQRLLFPKEITLSSQNMEGMELILPGLLKLGFDIDIFGEKNILVRAIPVILQKYDYQELLMDIAEIAATEGKHYVFEEFIQEMLIKVACHNSVRANLKLSIEEIKLMLNELDNYEDSHNCPHGRPIYFKMSLYEIEKKFKRKNA